MSDAPAKDGMDRYLSEAGARRYAGKFERGALRRFAAGIERARVAAALRAVDASGAVLDLPCGAGRFSSLLASSGFDALVSADLSAPMVRLTREGLAALGGPHRELAADAMHIGLKDGAADGAVSIRLHMHLVDPADRARYLAELARVCRRFLVISFLDRGALKQRWRLARARWSGRRRSRVAVTRAEFSAEAAAAGFTATAFFGVSSLFSGQVVAACRRTPD